jgi:hypothetical protein
VKTLAKLLYVQPDEEITDLVDRLRDLSLEDEVTFVVPERARSLQSAMSFRLLKRYADSYGKKVNLVSPEARLQAMALEAGFVAFPSMAAYDLGTEVHQAQPVGQIDPVSAPAGAAAPPTPAPARQPMQVNQVPSFAASDVTAKGVATLERPRQAAVVSAPPKKTTPPSGLPSAPPLRVYRPYAIGGAIVVLLALLISLLYLPTATATMLVSGTPIKDDVQLTGGQGVQTGGTQFATDTVQASQSVSLPGTPTGQKQIPAVKASGQVTFTSTSNCNSDNCSFTVPAGTQVSTSDGKVYVTDQDVRVTSQGKSVGVTALVPGAASNTDAGTVTTIGTNGFNGGLLNLLASVTNPQAITGGADARTATIIQQSDIDSVRDAYAKDAIGQVQDQLNSKAQGKKLVLVGNGVTATATADHKAGDEVGGFTVSVTVSGTGVVFDDSTVKKLIKEALQRKLPSGTELTNKLNITYDAGTATADGNVTLTGHASGFYVPVYLQSAIRAHLKGMSPDKAHAFLQSLPNVVDARVVQSPFGLPWLPFFSSRITLVIQEVATPSTS